MIPATPAAPVTVAPTLPTNGGATPTSTSKPAWLPDKFFDEKNPDKGYQSLAESYRQLEAKLAGKPVETPVTPPAPGATPTPEPKAPEAPKAETPLTMADAAKAAAAAPKQFIDERLGIADMSKLKELKPEQLAEHGIRPEWIGVFEKGLAAMQNERNNALIQVAGTEADYKSALAWGATNLSADEQASYDKVVQGTDANAAALAVGGMMAKFRAAVGSNPAVTVEGQRSNSSGAGYNHFDDALADMSKPEYKTNAAFRQKVQDGIADLQRRGKA